MVNMGPAAVAFLIGLTAQAQAPPKAPPQPEPKAQVPAEGEREAVRRQLRELFKDEFAKRDPQSRIALAKRFIADAAATTDPVQRFVMLVAARDAASGIGDIGTAYEAVDRIAEGFDLFAAGPGWSVSAQKLEILAEVRKKARTREKAGEIADAYLVVAREAILAGNFEVAADAAKDAGSVARSARSSGLSEDARNLSREIDALEKEFRDLKTAELKLSVDPADPEANSIVGRFYCFVRGEWERGIPCLAQGDDPGVKAVATLELAKPEDPARRGEIADAWLDLSKKERDKTAKERYVDRAWDWYQAALEKADGLTKLALEKKLDALIKSRKSGSKSDVMRGLIARWGFDDPGQPGYDTFRRHHAKPSAPGAKYARDPYRGGVMSFDGSGAHLVLPAHPSAGSGAATWAFWVNLSAAPTTSYSGQIYLQESSVWIAVSHGGIGIDMNGGGGWFDTQGGSVLGAIAGKGKITANQWHHIAFSWDGKTVRCFHNGVKTAEAPTVGPKSNAQVARLGPGSNRAMGARIGYSSYNLNGKLDEFRIYGRALSDREVMAVFRATLTGRSR